MKKNDKTLRKYHLPFFSGSTYIDLIRFSWIPFIISLLYYSEVCYDNQIGYYKTIIQLFVIVNAFSVVFSLIKRIYYKFQVTTFILIGINILIFILDMDIVGLDIFTNSNINSWRTLPYIIAISVTIIISSIYYVYCYKVKKKCVFGYGVANKKKGRSKKKSINYEAIFALVVMTPFLFIGNIRNFWGVIVGVVISGVFTGFMVDSFYSAYFIYKHPEYREKRE